MSSTIENVIMHDTDGFAGTPASERCARPTGRPHVGGPCGTLEREPPAEATIPPPPCDSCRLARRCAVRRESCAAFRYYVQANYPQPSAIARRLQADIRPLRTWTD